MCFYAFPSVCWRWRFAGAMGGGIGNGMLALTLVFIPPMCRVAETADDAGPRARLHRGRARHRREHDQDHSLPRPRQCAGTGIHLCLLAGQRQHPVGLGAVVFSGSASARRCPIGV